MGLVYDLIGNTRRVRYLLESRPISGPEFVFTGNPAALSHPGIRLKHASTLTLAAKQPMCCMRSMVCLFSPCANGFRQMVRIRIRSRNLNRDKRFFFLDGNDDVRHPMMSSCITVCVFERIRTTVRSACSWTLPNHALQSYLPH